MPLYEYRCAKCGKTFEKIQKFSAKPRAKCPECGGAGKRQLSAPAIRFKGTGWYVTDYAGKKSGESEEKKAPSAMTPYLMSSAIPAKISRRGSVRSRSGSMATRSG